MRYIEKETVYQVDLTHPEKSDRTAYVEVRYDERVGTDRFRVYVVYDGEEKPLGHTDTYERAKRHLGEYVRRMRDDHGFRPTYWGFVVRLVDHSGRYPETSARWFEDEVDLGVYLDSHPHTDIDRRSEYYPERYRASILRAYG